MDKVMSRSQVITEGSSDWQLISDEDAGLRGFNEERLEEGDSVPRIVKHLPVGNDVVGERANADYVIFPYLDTFLIM